MQSTHELAAVVEEAVVERLVSLQHLRDVVPRAEGRAFGFQHDHSHRRVAAQFVKSLSQRTHDFAAQGVALLGILEHDPS